MKYPWIDTQTGSERVPQARSFESLSWGDSSGFLLTNHLALPGSESVFGFSQDPPTCACTSVTQDGF